MKEMLSHTHVSSSFLYILPSHHLFSSVFFLQDYSKEAVTNVQKYLMKNEVPVNLFEVSHWMEWCHGVHWMLNALQFNLNVSRGLISLARQVRLLVSNCSVFTLLSILIKIVERGKLPYYWLADWLTDDIFLVKF